MTGIFKRFGLFVKQRQTFSNVIWDFGGHLSVSANTDQTKIKALIHIHIYRYNTMFKHT